MKTQNLSRHNGLQTIVNGRGTFPLVSLINKCRDVCVQRPHISEIVHATSLHFPLSFVLFDERFFGQTFNKIEALANVGGG